VAGLITFFDPLGRKVSNGAWVKLATLEALPPDGMPRRFPVLMDRVDAWTRTPHLPVGAVYLRRTSETDVTALNVVCPHAGCFVDYQAAKKAYLCPCHNSMFALDGKVASPRSPSPRAMDSLEVEIRNGNEIWIHFQNFQTGMSEKLPLA
jgi:Rieske Fe-S protein